MVHWSPPFAFVPFARAWRRWLLVPLMAMFADAHDEPEASASLKLLVRVIGPLAPEEML